MIALYEPKQCAFMILKQNVNYCFFCDGYDYSCDNYMNLHEYEEYLDRLDNLKQGRIK